MLSFLLWTVPVYIVFKIYQKLACGMCTSNAVLNGKVVIVTGANTGIGYETAKDLAKRGAKVIIACRSQEKGNEAKEKIVKETGNPNVLFKSLDLTSFKSVRDFVNDVTKTETALHVLVNNAGVGRLDNSLTEDNLPIEVQTNYFGPYLLTMLLLPMLKSSAPSRIVNVSSILHHLGSFDPNTFNKQCLHSTIKQMRLYSDTKLANILFTRKLSKILEGTGVTANSLHPGAVYTDIFRNKSRFSRFLIKLVFKTSWEGAQTSIHLAVSEDVQNVTGKYFSDCREAKMSSKALDDKLADQLWYLSEAVTSKEKKES